MGDTARHMCVCDMYVHTRTHAHTHTQTRARTHTCVYMLTYYVGQNGKWKAVMGDIARRHTKGQPIMVGTTSIQNSQQLSKLLEELKVCERESARAWVGGGGKSERRRG